MMSVVTMAIPQKRYNIIALQHCVAMDTPITLRQLCKPRKKLMPMKQLLALGLLGAHAKNTYLEQDCNQVENTVSHVINDNHSLVIKGTNNTNDQYKAMKR